MIPDIKNYYNVFRKSQEALVLLNSVCFPLDLSTICDELGIILVTKQDYLNYRQDTNSLNQEICIKDGRSYLAYINGEKIYTIIYDEKPYWRWRFTIAHELGHILLGHLNDERLQIERGGIDTGLYQELENEADVFAGNFLAPPVLINEKLRQYNFPYPYSTISNTFQISTTSVQYYRYKDYQIWLSKRSLTNSEIIILKIHKREMHITHCLECNAEMYYCKSKFCVVCGSKKIGRFKWSKNKTMTYSKIELNENQKPLECPRCKNEHLPSDGEYCQICGGHIYNNCTNVNSGYNNCEHGERLDGDARYCPYCGSPTTYYLDKLLKDYKEEFEQPSNNHILTTKKVTNEDDNNDDYPF